MSQPLIARPLVAMAVLAAVVLSVLGPSQPWTLAIGHPTSDMSDHLHGMWWFGGEVLAGRWPDFSATTHFPGGTPLWFADPIGALLALGLRPLGPTLAYNGAIALQLWLAGVAGWAMARDFGASAAAALVAGVFLCTSPYLLGLTHSGITEGLGLAPLVLLCWSLLKAMGRGPSPGARGRWAFLWPGLALILVGLQSPVYLVGGVLLSGACALGCFSKLPQRMATLAGIAVVALGPMLLLRHAIEGTLVGGDQVAGSLAPGWQPEGLPATDLLGFFQPGAHYFPDTPALGNPGVLHVHYLGWLALIGAALGWKRAPWLRLPAVVMAIVCLGPSLCINAQHIPSLESPWLLPLALIYLDGSPMDFVHHPYRLVALVLPILALFLALGLSGRRPAWVGLIAVGIVAEALLLSPAPWPLPASDTSAPAIYSSLPPGPVMDWPPDGTDWNRRYLRWQTVHGHPIAYGVNTTFPDAARHDPLLWASFFQLSTPTDQLMNRDIPWRLPKKSRAPDSLASQGFSSLVFHGEALEPGDRQRTLKALFQAHGPPPFRDGLTYGWAVKPEPPQGTGRPE